MAHEKQDTVAGRSGSALERGVSQRFVVYIGAREVPLKPADYRLLRRVKAAGALEAKHVRGADWARINRLRRAGLVGDQSRTWTWHLTQHGLAAVEADSRLANVRANRTAEADVDWPRKENPRLGLERPGNGCRSGSGG